MYFMGSCLISTSKNSDTKGSVLQECPPTPCPSYMKWKSRLSPELLSNWLYIRGANPGHFPQV